MDSDKIGRFIYQLRTERKLSQYQLADMIPISRQAVSKWERGVTIPDSSTLICLSRIFEVSINELLNGERDPKEDLQSTTLNIIDESNKKTKTIKRTITISISIITILLLAFLSYYFITSYNTTEVYKVGNDNGLFTLTDGILIKTKERLYIRLGNLNSNEDVEIKKIEYCYIKDEKEKLIAQDKDLYNLLIEHHGYNESGLFKDINIIKKNSYLKITYDDDKVSVLRLRYVKDFSNDKLFIHKKQEYTSTPKIEKEDTKIEEVQKIEEKQEVKVKETKPVEEKPKAEEKPKTEEKPKKEETPKAEDKPKEEDKIETKPVIKEVTAENIINEIKAKGEMFEGTYSYEHVEENYSITFYYFENLKQIMMEDSNEDTWMYMIPANSFMCDSIFDSSQCKEKVNSDVIKYLFS